MNPKNTQDLKLRAIQVKLMLFQASLRSLHQCLSLSFLRSVDIDVTEYDQVRV